MGGDSGRAALRPSGMVVSGLDQAKYRFLSGSGSGAYVGMDDLQI